MVGQQVGFGICAREAVMGFACVEADAFEMALEGEIAERSWGGLITSGLGGCWGWLRALFGGRTISD